MTMSAARRRLELALVPVKLPMAARIGESMSRRGTDVTAASAGRSCVVLAPHPDDETLGCGATVMRKIDGGAGVQVIVISDGATWPPWRTPEENIAVRDAELRASCRILGLADEAVTHLSFPETRLDSAGDSLVDAVADAVRSHTPD
jgi:LmbE family N-acetylglucosaminyl deacetylase